MGNRAAAIEFLDRPRFSAVPVSLSKLSFCKSTASEAAPVVPVVLLPEPPEDDEETAVDPDALFWPLVPEMAAAAATESQSSEGGILNRIFTRAKLLMTGNGNDRQ